MSCRIESEAESLRTRGNEHYRSGHYSEALADYSTAIELLVSKTVDASSTTTPASHNLLLSRLYHNRALTISKAKLGDGKRNDEEAEAQADARRATELDPTYVKAWALCARLLEEAAHGDVRRVEEALDITHRVMELELCNADAMDTMEKLVRLELVRLLEKTPLYDKMSDTDVATAFSKLDAINGEVELNRLLMYCINSLFEIQQFRTVYMEKRFIEKETKMYHVLAVIFHKLGNFRMSISCGFLSIHLLNQLDPSPQVKANKVAALFNLQTAYVSGGQQRSLHTGKWIEMALQLHDDADSAQGIRLRITAAEVHMSRLEYTRVVEELKQCLEVCTQKGYRAMGAEARVELALALCELGNYEAGLSIAQEAKSEFEAMGHVSGVAAALKNIGTAHLGLKQFDEALSSFELALNHNPDPVAVFEITNFIGNVYWYKAWDCIRVQCDNDGADPLLQMCKKYYIEARNQAIKMNDEWRLLKADTSLAQTNALLDKTEKQDQVAQFFESLLDRAEKSKFPGLGNIYLEFTKFSYDHREFENAIKAGLKAENSFARVIQDLKDDEAILTRKDRENDKACSILLQMCYICNNCPEDALIVFERSKTRFSNILISARNIYNKKITIENIKDIAVQIKSSIVVLSDVGPFLLCWLILPNKNMPIKFFPFFYRTELLNGVETPVELKVTSIKQMHSETFRGSRTFPPSNSDSSFQSEKNSKMFDIVLQNIEADLCSAGGFNSMVIVPDGEYYNARFSCAKSGNSSSTPLCFKYALSISTSLSMILDTNSDTIESNNQIKRLFIISDPRSNLPFAIEESNLLNDIFQEQGDWNVDALIGSNATKQRVAEGLAHCNIIHIAAHANLKLDTQQVLRGSILLSSDSDSLPDGESDSELTYKEISLLDLSKLELAFLNCCETGSGRVYSEGLVGLARAFFLAGARQVVVYRGPLPDTEHTTAFVRDFYAAYTRTNRADVALAAAQRAAHEAGVPKDFWAQYYVMMRHSLK